MKRVSGDVCHWNPLLLAVWFALVCVGCASTATAQKPGGGIEWPGRRDVSDITNLGAVDGGVALDARVFKWRDVYYVTVDERFDRCGEARSRFPDWFESYAVSPAGVVLARRGSER